MGIDLGTSHTLVYIREKGIIIHEPSVVAVNTRTDQILAVGEDAKRMLGRTPHHISISYPLVHGVISDFEVTEKMLRYFIHKVHQEHGAVAPRPRVVIGIPLGVTEVERKAVEDAVRQAGAREVLLVETVIAAAIGARLPIQESRGMIVADLGGGATHMAVMSLGGIVLSRSLPLGGNELDQMLIQYVREKCNLLIGPRTAEEIKIKVGAVVPLKQTLEMSVRGRDLVSGLPREITITNRETQEAFLRPVKTIVDALRDTLEGTPPELIADIYRTGLVLTGGTSLLRGLPDVIQKELTVPVHVADDPMTAVVRGTGILLEDEALLREVVLPAEPMIRRS